MRDLLKVNVLMVVSGEVFPVNSLEGTNTLLRLQAAKEAAKTGKYHIVICSGGHTHKRTIETQPAADTMMEWCLAQPDWPEDVVVIAERYSLDTYFNVFLTLQELIGSGFDPSITVVSHWTHVVRLKLIFWFYAKMRVQAIWLNYPIGLKEFIVALLGVAYTLYDPKGEAKMARNERQKRRVQAADPV